MLIHNGDHAQYEIDNAQTPPKERSDWPLPSFDAVDWAEAFCKTATKIGYKDAEGKPVDEGWMIGWFANSLMRGFDEANARAHQAWQPIDTYKKDGTLVLLLVDADQDGEDSSMPTEDALTYRTIGHNNFDHDGEDQWQFAGWCWSHDHFVGGRGKPSHWMPECPDEGDPLMVCKHCPAWREMCDDDELE